MATRYLRTVRAIVGGGEETLTIEDLFIRFRLRREATSTPASGTVEIFNLNETNEVRIRERGKRICLLAGYGDDPSLIFDGSIRRVERLRAGLDRITRIHVGGRAVAEPRRSMFVRSYEGEVTIRDIVRDGVTELGFQIGPVDLIPEEAVETDFTYSGPTRLMISQRLDPFGVKWYEDGGVIYFTRMQKTGDDRPAGVTISEQTGMIGSPTVTDDGIRVRMLLDDRLKLDTRFQVQTSVISPGASGERTSKRAAEIEGAKWKVIEVTHAGDNREGEFSTTVEGRPISAG